MPEISVVMSVYNGEATLAATLESLLTQTGCDFEIIVIDDGSTDRSGEMLDAWAATEPRLRVIRQVNQGLTRALIHACGEARGEFIARQDVGDVSLAGRLDAQAGLLRNRSEVAFVSCRYRLVGPLDELLTDVDIRAESASDSNLENRDGSKVRSPHHGSVMFRKSAYVAAGGYRPQFYFAQDVDLWSRLIDQGDLAYVDRVLYVAKFDLRGISARHRSHQEALRTLIDKAQSLRYSGQSDKSIVEEASKIRPANRNDGGAVGRESMAPANYFVGSCLQQRGDRRAIGYLVDVVRENPFHIRAWIKLLLAVLKPNRQLA